jgi:dTMP kinase
MSEVIRPALIAFEGMDASGKNTQSKLLRDRIAATGREVSFYSFPRYETPLGVHIKRLLYGELELADSTDSGGDPSVRRPQDEAWALVYQCMMNSDKYDADVDIKADLKAGRVVICDRWSASAIAYGTADGLSLEWLERTRSALTKADLTIVLQVSGEEALRRRPKLRDRYERDREKQSVVAKNYGDMLLNSEGWALVDGESHKGDLALDIQNVHARVWHVVLARLGSSTSL